MDVKIIMDQHTPRIKVEPFEYIDGSFDILCRNLHTLVGIQPNSVNYDCINENNLIPAQFCYSSVAVVEEVAYRYSNLFEIGDKVVITPYLKKYIGVEDLKKEQRIIYKKGNSGIDDVDSLFYPLICYALALLDEIEGYQNILFLGCNLIGILLLKLFHEENIAPFVCLDELDVSEKLLYKNGANKVIQFTNGGFSEIVDKCDVIILNSYPENIVNEIQTKYPHIPIVKGKQWNREQESRAFNILLQQSIQFDDLISHHEHAENILLLTEELKLNKYNGKAIVFDW